MPVSAPSPAKVAGVAASIIEFLTAQDDLGRIIDVVRRNLCCRRISYFKAASVGIALLDSATVQNQKINNKVGKQCAKTNQGSVPRIPPPLAGTASPHQASTEPISVAFASKDVEKLVSGDIIAVAADRLRIPE